MIIPKNFNDRMILIRMIECLWVNILPNAPRGGWKNKLFWAKFSKIRILRPRSAQKNCSFTMFFGQNPPKTRYFSSKWAFFLICFIIWHLFLIIWQMFPKIIIFALQQIKIFQNHPLSKIRIFWKNIHPWSQHKKNDLQSVGKSLTFRGTVNEARELMKTHKCSDPVCSTQLFRVRKDIRYCQRWDGKKGEAWSKIDTEQSCVYVFKWRKS